MVVVGVLADERAANGGRHAQVHQLAGWLEWSILLATDHRPSPPGPCSLPRVAEQLQSLVVGLPHLRVLQLNSCPELGHLVLDCPSLVRLGLQSSPLSLEDLTALVARCPALQELDLQYCGPHLSGPAAAVALREARPSLHILFPPPHP